MDKKFNFHIDEYGIFLVWVGIVITVISYFTKSTFLNVLSLLVVLFAVFRSFSRNTIKRVAENQLFMTNVINPIKKQFRGFKKETFGDKDHKYVSCPNCGQKLRIPKKKGKIKVRCPKCGNKFEARS